MVRVSADYYKETPGMPTVVMPRNGPSPQYLGEGEVLHVNGFNY